MATTRLFVEQKLSTGKSTLLPEAAGHHVARVLRMKPDQAVILFNGQGGEFNAVITSINKSSVEVYLNEFVDIERESPINIELIQGLSKGDKMDFTIQKAVELGVNKITPLITTYSNVKLDQKRTKKKLEHWRKVIISACEQCGRNQIAELTQIKKLEDLQTTDEKDLKLILAPDAEKTLADFSDQIKTIHLVIGPEGGLSRSEIETLEKNGFIAIKLGSRILRTETAALAVVAALQNQLGDY
ncbi:MAG: 16S rRNA (uracil(1498)-N(3))-methyltransferase [Gammaproteobacteria bacterium]